MEIKKCDLEKPYIFISYSSVDKELVQEDVREFQRRGYNVWLDDVNLDKTKSSWKSDALNAIEDMDCRLVVFYVSRASLTSEPCLNELRKTKEKNSMIYHQGVPVPFIAVEVKQITNILTLQNQISKEIIDAKDMEKEVKKQKIKVLSDFITEFFDNNNERVRIHAKNIQENKEAYYKDIVKCFPDETKNKEVYAEAVSPAEETVDETSGAAEVASEENDLTDALYEEEDAEQVGTSKEDEDIHKKKVSSVTGDITYSLYGEVYTENQSDMMLRFFAQVLKRHQGVVAELPEYKGMNCVSAVNYSDPEQSREDMPSYFCVNRYFTYPNGAAICVGTAYSLADKLKKMALLLDITGEDGSVFSSEQVELPKVKTKTEKGTSSKNGNGADVAFEVFGKSYTASQVDMLGIVFSTFIQKHPARLQDIADACTCLDIIDYSLVDKEDRPCYFRSSYNVYEVNGVRYSVGGGFSLKEKLRMIGVLIAVCEEAPESVKVEGEAVEVKKVSARKVKQEKQFL